MAAYASFGIHPRTIAGYTQYYDVIAAMLERGLGVASFSDALLTPAVREHVLRLYPMQDWRLLWYSKPQGSQPYQREVADFLLSSVIDDPGYPVLRASSGIEHS